MSCSTKSAWDGKIIEREEFSNYRPVPPLRRSFQITVGIIALVLRTVKKIEKLLIKKRIKEGKASIGKLQSLSPHPKFISFNVFSRKPPKETEHDPLIRMFGVEGFLTKSEKKVMLTDKELSFSLSTSSRRPPRKFSSSTSTNLWRRLEWWDKIMYCKSWLLES